MYIAKEKHTEKEVEMDDIESRVHLYREVIKTCITSDDVLSRLPDIISQDEATRLRQLYERDRQKATGKMLDAILHSTEPGKWQMFLSALKEEEYDYIASLLSSDGRPKETSCYERRIIQLFWPKLVKIIDPSELVSHLYQKRVINMEDMQYINTRYNTTGRLAGASILLDRMQCRRKPEEWYKVFLEVLNETGYSQMVDEIEPDFNKCPHNSDAEDTVSYKFQMPLLLGVHKADLNDQRGKSDEKSEPELRIKALKHGDQTKKIKGDLFSDNGNPQGRKQDFLLEDSVTKDTSSVAAAGDHNFKKYTDNTLDQRTLNRLNDTMNSVGALVCNGNQIATVFRAGSKFVITAAHSVSPIIDATESGLFDWSNLNDPTVMVSFQYPQEWSNIHSYKIKRITYYHADYDVAVLELADPDQLPPKLKLSKVDPSHTHVHIIGYGHQSNMKKLDPNCEVILPTNPCIPAAKVWLQENKGTLSKCLKKDVQLSSADWGFHGLDKREKILFSCYLEKGSSGAPILAINFLSEPIVVGMVTNGLPYCFWQLSPNGQLLFPDKYRFEMGTRMSAIVQEMTQSDPALANDLF